MPPRHAPVPFHGNHHRDPAQLREWTGRRNETALEPDLPIVDPHHHLWDDDRGVYLVGDYVADADRGHHVVASVYAQYRAMYRADGPVALRPVGEVEFVNGQAASSASGRYGPIRVAEGIIGFADLRHGDEAGETLDALMAAGNGRLCGIRHGATWDDGAAATGRSFGPRGLLLDPAFRRGFAQLERRGLVFDAWLFYHQLSDLEDLLAAFPDMPVVLDHCGGLLGIEPHVDRDAVHERWRARLDALARFPNLSVKIGGLGMLNLGWDFHLRDMPPSSEELADAWRPYVDGCIDTFGAGRCMFESNFPMDQQSCGFDALWNAFKRITESRTPAEKAALYHDNAVLTYRLPRGIIGELSTEGTT